MGTESLKYNAMVFYTVEYCRIPNSHMYLTFRTVSLQDKVHTVQVSDLKNQWNSNWISV